MNEFELIARVTPKLPIDGRVVRGAGDDCAVLDIGIKDELLLFKTDAVVEGVHFTPETEPRKVGRKALARVLSDIAAAAGKPVSCLVTMGMNQDRDEGFFFEFYEGLNALAREVGMSVTGGDTTGTTGPFFASVSAIGTIPRGRVITRSGAMDGDALFVSGQLGGSLEGKHLDFRPRLEEARWLADHFEVHAMMDVSDGLAGDLRQIMNASNVGAELLSSAIPISRAARLKGRLESSAKPPFLAALTDGEDYELLFTVKAADAVPVLDRWKRQFPDTGLSCIGKITTKHGLRVRDKTGVREIAAHGYTHFEKS